MEVITRISLPTAVTETKSLLMKFNNYKRVTKWLKEVTGLIVSAYMDAEKSSLNKIKVTKNITERDSFKALYEVNRK